MVVRIRLQRLGHRNLPYFRIVAADSRAPRDGKFLEKVNERKLKNNKYNSNLISLFYSLDHITLSQTRIISKKSPWTQRESNTGCQWEHSRQIESPISVVALECFQCHLTEYQFRTLFLRNSERRRSQPLLLRLRPRNKPLLPSLSYIEGWRLYGRILIYIDLFSTSSPLYMHVCVCFMRL